MNTIIQSNTQNGLYNIHILGVKYNYCFYFVPNNTQYSGTSEHRIQWEQIHCLEALLYYGTCTVAGCAFNIHTAVMHTFALSLQAQVGGKFTPTSFASAYNCESYLSHVSLMGVVAVLILIGVLYCSIVFMFQMKSMDRFDDPRGPTISVENLH